MGIHGRVAVHAVEIFVQGVADSPRAAWSLAAEKLHNSPSNQEKDCPRSAFLGLCEDGFVKGIPAGEYMDLKGPKGKPNKRYAINAVAELMKDASLIERTGELWNRVGEGTSPTNSQLDVVISLWNEDLIVCPIAPTSR